jgi:hypothetical protein
MIIKANSFKVFLENIQRTDMLIEAVDKIKAYNRLYQDRAYVEEYKYGKMVEEIQNAQLVKIGNSCSEHAIISLATTFETFCKELIQQLLSEFPDFFQKRNTKYSKTIEKLTDDKTEYDYEVITKKLNLYSRFDFNTFYKTYGLVFLTVEESNLVEYIYLKRNSFVHNGNRMDSKTKLSLKNSGHPVKEVLIATESKKLRTKIKVLIPKIQNRLIDDIISKKI